MQTIVLVLENVNLRFNKTKTSIIKKIINFSILKKWVLLEDAMSFGQVVIGPPGSGKTTYCHGMKQFLTSLGRNVAVINLDPANDCIPYEVKIDISSLITLNDVSEMYILGPNGGLLYCMEYLETNYDWLEAQLEELVDSYLLFDCPGQVELFIHHNSLRNIIEKLTKVSNHRLTCINLIDSYYCNTPFTYLSALLVSLSTMLQMELPHINVLSKIDLVEKYGKLDFNLEYYAEASNLNHLIRVINQREKRSEKFKRLSTVLCELVEQVALVSFTTLNINEKESLVALIKLIDKSNGFIYTSKTSEEVLNMVQLPETDFEYFSIAAVQEKYMNNTIRPVEGNFSDQEEEEDEKD